MKKASLLVLLLSAAMMTAAAQEPESSKNDERFIYKYVVKGHSQQDPNDRELSLRYDAKTDAEKDLEERKYSNYNRNGLLYGSTDKPLNMRVVTLQIPRDSPSEARELPPELPSFGKGKRIEIEGPKALDPGQPKKGEAKVPSLAGKKGVGFFGKHSVSVEFTGEGEKGEFVVSVEGKVVGRGKWIQLGPFVRMETDNWDYEGKLAGDKLAGTRKPKPKAKVDAGKEKWWIDLSGKRADHPRQESEMIAYNRKTRRRAACTMSRLAAQPPS